jgi:hypothetical protein
MARISDNTFTSLKAAQVDVSKLLASLNSALSKKSLVSHSVTQGRTSFKQSEKAEIERRQLTDHEDYALVINAFDSYMVKGYKRWATDDESIAQWPIPASMIHNCKNLWPFVVVETPAEKVKA